LKEWITLDSRNTPSNTNAEEEGIVGALENDGKASMPERVKRPNPWRRRKKKKKKMMMTIRNTQPLEEMWMNGKDGRLSVYRIEIYAASFTLCM
jgi:hypothetical protein